MTRVNGWWRHIFRVAALATLTIELREVLLGRGIHPELILLAAGLAGIPWAVRKGNGS